MITDNFNDDGTLVTHWDILAGAAVVAAGVLQITSVPQGYLRHKTPLAGTDQYAQCVVTTTRSTGVCVRVVDQWQGFYLSCGANGAEIKMGEIFDGSFGSFISGTVIPAAGDRLRLEVRGRYAIGRLFAADGTLRDMVEYHNVPAPDPTGLYAGLCRSGSGPGGTHIDDFEAGELPSADLLLARRRVLRC